jgi:hypothetical protein
MMTSQKSAIALAAFLAAISPFAARAGNPNVPASSPYAAMDLDALQPIQETVRPRARMIEGRAAAVEGEVAPRREPVAGSGGDIIVHTRRSYLDPGASADVGTENRYFYDTAHFDYRSEGPDFTRNSAGFELLPGQFGPN